MVLGHSVIAIIKGTPNWSVGVRDGVTRGGDGGKWSCPLSLLNLLVHIPGSGPGKNSPFGHVGSLTDKAPVVRL